jgi:hypothetical protein
MVPGTVDVTTYKVDNRLPLRLSEELVDSDGMFEASQ